MSENPYTPSSNPQQPGSTPAGADGTWSSPYNTAYPAPGQPGQMPNGKKPRNVVGLVALGLGVLGFILACIPGVMILGWLLLLAALVVGIVGLFQKNREKISSIIAIVLSVVGSIVSAIVLFVVVVNSLGSSPEPQQSFEERAPLVASPSATASRESLATEERTTPAPVAEAPSSRAATPASSEPAASASSDAAASSAGVPREYTSALSKANDYLRIMDFSYAGLYDQLTSEYGEKFSPEAAQYAVDNVKADWNEEALGSAQNYIDIMHFSNAGLYEQLTSEFGEQFTPEQAQYAVDNVKADWNEEALEAAQSYQEMDMSSAAIYDQLISEYGEQFTPEQAQYAVDHL
ncbi:Ltp family lipoprotein [Rothia aerolata]|uniref:Putative host cell surface-exposed lipoprotein Ltp-like HTH region domain-containing protein n=1 Tax=Rothia aerolata TaxID=1812262 RepID=A0A917IUX8_9MICC|nr:Ltp family lipoprotein [Rothia aerolata]GGH64332.1 hypothetical protein GCM10007359_16530 [Rothia aerolata]